jgi:ribosomal protein S2
MPKSTYSYNSYTNSNPNIADLFIPASDDSSSGIPLILDELAEAVLAGQNS